MENKFLFRVMLFLQIRRICVLYGLLNETWEVNLPVEEVPLELPEPALGINFARDRMQEKDWKRLFQLINDLPTIFEVVTGNIRQPKDQSGPHSNSSKIKSSGKMQQPQQPESQPKTVKTSPSPKLEDESGGDEE
ncbi:PHD finger protein Alfin1 [Camellia lanceoleosa]|uniref:PHD finger protein Alfin1 n=1 Tax=Camellia lanceoleosa TaxID=1840588 RepID=A0ACC0I697_9ERIC|nr:PHD finger protein Alfin1 [Camellia lanceoleosa]